MSGWRVMAKELYEAGGSLPYESVAGCNGRLERLRQLGLARTTGKRGRGDTWALTPLGVDYCEGRVSTHYGRGGRIFFHATWLASLPRGL